MIQNGGTGERIYGRLKAAVLAGSLTPHARLDFAELAQGYGVSTTPVREAAMRLLGEGLLEVHPRGGTRPALASEVLLRTLLDLNAKFASAAIDWAVSPVPTGADQSTDDQEKRTRHLFRDLAKATANAEFVCMVERLSDRLAPYRHRETQLIADAEAELAALRSNLQSPVLLRRGLRGYHRRRASIVAQLVWMTNSDPQSTG